MTGQSQTRARPPHVWTQFLLLVLDTTVEIPQPHLFEPRSASVKMKAIGRGGRRKSRKGQSLRPCSFVATITCK